MLSVLSSAQRGTRPVDCRRSGQRERGCRSFSNDSVAVSRTWTGTAFCETFTVTATTRSRPCAMLQHRRSRPSCGAAEDVHRRRRADALLFSTPHWVRMLTTSVASSTDDCSVCSSTRLMSAWRSCAAVRSTESRVTWGRTPACETQCPWNAGSRRPGGQARWDVDLQDRRSPHREHHSTAVSPATCTVNAHHQWSSRKMNLYHSTDALVWLTVWLHHTSTIHHYWHNVPLSLLSFQDHF